MGHISFWLTLMMWIYWEITDTRKKNTETLIDASKKVGLEINVEKTRCMLLSQQNVGQNSKQIVWKCATVQLFGDDSNKSKEYNKQRSMQKSHGTHPEGSRTPLKYPFRSSPSNVPRTSAAFSPLSLLPSKSSDEVSSSLVVQVREGGGLLRPRNFTIVGYFYYLMLLKLLHVSVVRPSSSRNILARITRLTTNPLFLEYRKHYGSL
jgi:hypothetical protein